MRSGSRRNGVRSLWLGSLSVALLCAVLAGTASGFSIKELMGIFDTKASASVAEDFELPDLNGDTVALADYRNERPVLLYFWATWCPSCQAVKPELSRLRRDTREEDLEILGINVGTGDSLEKVKRFQKAHPVPFKILYDAGGRVAQSYGVQGIPLFVLIDRDGSVVFRDHQLPERYQKYLKTQ